MQQELLKNLNKNTNGDEKMGTYRKDGKSNKFSEIHYKLGNIAYMSDLDCLQGHIKSGFVDIGFAINGEDNLYNEYKLNGDEMVIIAIYDYKHNLTDYIKNDIHQMTKGKSLWCQYQLAKKLKARSFVVCGTNGELPLTFIETTSGRPEIIGTLKSNQTDKIRDFWQTVLKIS